MIELRAGALRCELLPALGGCVAGLWLDGEPVLRSTAAAQLASARLAACHPLVPFSNRVGHASVVWQGTQQPLVRNSGDPPHAIHGVAAQRAWEVLDSDGASAMLAYEHRPDASWPFAFDCSHTLRVTPSGLEMTLALTNQAGRPAPAGLGWYPRFPKRPGSHVRLQAAGRWQFGADWLPAARVASTGLTADATTLAADDCFDGWAGTVELADNAQRVLVGSGLGRVVVHATASGEDIVIAPVSHVPNAVHLYAAGADAAALGLAVLAPGETLVAQMRIAVEKTA